MALPPDSAEAFAREVDENLRRDQTEEWFKKNAPLIGGAMLLFLAAVAGFLYWKDSQQKQSAVASEQMIAAMESAGSDRDGTLKKIEPLTTSSSDGIAAEAKLMKAALLLGNGDRQGALAIYKALAEDGGQPQPVRDLALIRQTTLEFDNLAPDAIITRLAPLAKPESAWFGSAGEMTAMALLKQNKKAEAGKLFAAIAADRNVPVTIRSRAVQIAGTLGVDATAAIADISKG